MNFNMDSSVEIRVYCIMHPVSLSKWTIWFEESPLFPPHPNLSCTTPSSFPDSLTFASLVTRKAKERGAGNEVAQRVTPKEDMFLQNDISNPPSSILKIVHGIGHYS